MSDQVPEESQSSSVFGEDPGGDLSKKEETHSTQQKLAVLRLDIRITLVSPSSHEGREARIRKSKREALTAILQSAKLTIADVEAIANAKEIDEEVLKMIAENREWVKHYCIVLALARNPKTPTWISLKFVSQLLDRDVRCLSMDRSVPDPVRRMAARIARAKKL